MTVIAERPRLAPAEARRWRSGWRRRSASSAGCVNVKATTNEGMGFVGRGEGIAALAVATLERDGADADDARSASRTRSRGDLRQLEPREPGKVGIYVCGPTVYGRIHVGNARPYVVFALFKRFLEHEGYDVTLVENITDINDKIYVAAGARESPSDALAREMTALYRADTDRLGLGRPDSEPLASETIAEIVALIEALIERGHAYASQGDVYFSVRSFREYGKLSNRRLEDLGRRSGRARRGAGAQARPARLRAVEGPQGRRGHCLGVALGPRPARVAHRVLGDGGEAARPGLRRARRRAPTSCFHTTRTRSPRPRPRAASRSRASGCTTA